MLLFSSQILLKKGINLVLICFFILSHNHRSRQKLSLYKWKFYTLNKFETLGSSDQLSIVSRGHSLTETCSRVRSVSLYLGSGSTVLIYTTLWLSKHSTIIHELFTLPTLIYRILNIFITMYIQNYLFISKKDNLLSHLYTPDLEFGQVCTEAWR